MYELVFKHDGDKRPFVWTGKEFLNEVSKPETKKYKTAADAEKDRAKSEKWCDENNANGTVSVRPVKQ